MSFQAMTWAVGLKLPPLAKLLLLTLANYADAEGRCWPSKETLAEDTGMSKASVCKYLSELEAAGVLSVERRTVKGAQVSSVITLLTPVRQTDSPCPSDGQPLSATRTTPVRHTDRPLSATRTQTYQDKPINEPKEVEATASPSPPPPSFPSSDDIEFARSLWNDMADQAGLARIAHLSDHRRAKLRQRLKTLGSREAWHGLLERVYGSPFCRGENDRGWRADFDFVLQEKSFTRLLEGFYETPKPTSPKFNRRAA